MLAIVGGTGLYQLQDLTGIRQISAETPYGWPSAPITIGKIRGHSVAFLPRHGGAHTLLPGEINYRANIYALKKAGARRIVSISAVGSLAMEVAPGHLSVPTQYLDFTKGTRAFTFLGQGLVAHISTAEPACPGLVQAVTAKAGAAGVPLHAGTTYACVEGPRLGNRAESRMLQKVGATLVGMTNVPEVYLAREAGLCYCTIGVVTDYDCWLEDPSQHATVEIVIARYKQSLERVRRIITGLAADMAKGASTAPCSCSRALEGAVMTPEQALSPEKRELLGFLRS